MADYKAIYDKMEDGELYSAKRLMVAPASLTAMVKRGMLERVGQKSPYLYKKCKSNKLAQIIELVNKHKADYFTIYLQDKELGMLCSLKNGSVFDCYGNSYDIRNAIKITFHNDGQSTEYILA